MKTLNFFTTPGHLSVGVVCVSPMELAAGQKSARVRHAQVWNAERVLPVLEPIAYTGGATSGVTTTTHNSIQIDAPSAHERSRT